MKLNRTQALFLVGTIAAVGCVVDNSDDGGDGGDDSSAGDAGEGGTSGSGATGGTTSGASGTYTGGTSTGGSGGEGGATCLDDASSPVMCEGFAEPGAGGMGAGGDGYGGAGGIGGPACEGWPEAQDLLCADLWTNFKPGVANAARTCMNAQTPEDLCTWDFSFGCASEAILAACPDDSADDECEAIMAGCPDLTLADCSSVLGAMTQAGRDLVVSCAAGSLECNPWICAGVASPAGE